MAKKIEIGLELQGQDCYEYMKILPIFRPQLTV